MNTIKKNVNLSTVSGNWRQNTEPFKNEEENNDRKQSSLFPGGVISRYE